MEQLIVDTLKISILEMIILVGPLVIIGFILGLMERKANSNFLAAFGYKGILATAWLGTPVHEIGHALMCLIFGHKITALRLLLIDRADGTLGYVTHSYNRRSIFQTIGNFFIGIGPLFSGLGVLFLTLYFLLPNSFKAFEFYLKEGTLTKALDLTFIKGLANAGLVLLRNIFTLSNLANLHFWIFLVIAIAVSSHMALSSADIKGANQGLIVLYAIIFTLTLTGNIMHFGTFNYISQLARYNTYVLALSALALIFSFLTTGLSYILYFISRIAG